MHRDPIQAVTYPGEDTAVGAHAGMHHEHDIGIPLAGDPVGLGLSTVPNATLDPQRAAPGVGDIEVDGSAAHSGSPSSV